MSRGGGYEIESVDSDWYWSDYRVVSPVVGVKGLYLPIHESSSWSKSSEFADPT